VSGEMANIDSVFFSSVSSGSGGGHLWDFSTLLFSPTDSALVVDVASSPAADSFPTANLCIKSTSDADTANSWVYSASEPSYFELLGSYISSPQGDFWTVYTDIAPDYVFPMQYGSSWTSYRHYVAFATDSIESTVADTTFNEVDAYGQIKYGNRTLDCLRIKSTDHNWSTTSYLGFPVSSDLSVTERYTFITSGMLSAVEVWKFISQFGNTYSCNADPGFTDQPTLVDEYDQSTLPKDFTVGQNYPNPFNPSTAISYGLPHSANVSLDIFNVMGEVVKHFDLGLQPAGNHTITIDLMKDISPNLASGVYFYRLSAGSLQETRKMMLLK